ncbi:MAG: CPBP family intramembrane metalloprotease, partial [Erysipelotrichaceae bacterium]|nr:CPBP family intramembrane metalloprotease [Erysipelotrichaceae bacterium]
MMKKENKSKTHFFLKHPILSGIGFLLFYQVIADLLKLGKEFLPNQPVIMAVYQFAFTAGLSFLMALWVKKALKNGFTLGFTGKNLLECLKFGWVFPAMIIIELIIGEAPLSALSNVTFTGILTALILAASAGFSEEFILRSMTANTMMTAWLNKKNGVYTAMIASSVIFGLAHAFNIAIVGLTPNVVWQVLYAFALGLVFSAMFLRTKNIWGCIIMHTLVDFVSFLWAGGSSTVENLQASLTGGFTLIGLIYRAVLFVTAVAVALYLVRPSK